MPKQIRILVEGYFNAKTVNKQEFIKQWMDHLNSFRRLSYDDDWLDEINKFGDKLREEAYAEFDRIHKFQNK